MTSRKLLNDCFLTDKDRLSHEECLAILTSRLSVVAGIEEVPLGKTSGRWLATDITAPRNVPMHDNSAVDGYAFAAPVTGPMPVVTHIVAGDLRNHRLEPGQAARIFTGAVMPEGADTVAMQEDCTVNGDQVSVPLNLKRGANARRAGEDVAEGSAVLQSSARLRPQDMAALASFGLARVKVRAPIRVAILSNGDELLEPGAEIAQGQVYDSNRAMLQALIDTLPCEVTDLGILPDNAALIEATLTEVAKTHDVILTSGGASRGDEDHIITAIDNLGTRHLWQIAVKPGRPMSFGQIGDCVFLGLPGNPVAAFVCFLLYVRPSLTVLGGGNHQEPVRFPVAAGFDVPDKKPGRREFWRGWLEPGDGGRPVAHKFARDGSGLISGLRQATGLIEITESMTSVAKGDLVSFLPFTSFGIDS
ncbi:molybdopterin molybdotransferase MoeA [Hoeflea sp. YIM 152468]|uniref:molybdopterin molybdotransferase MoeA n=1 Tax=Hoeflea sp. YIM 152468 TaxID=3031759 RepID=UPI0023DAA32B|nr:gephyrin-like molybdotransferase Glp [Hoeflea sp. YIM 152468]MDF1606832.1 molybdopterin molybdotransferase MoeA [Hoeflea sp. YIM 152468]